MGNWIEKELSEGSIKTAPLILYHNKKHPVDNEKKIYYGEKIRRRAMLEPNRRFTESVFFAGNKEIASYKNINDKIFDIKGDIPDGEVEFVNITEKTHGTEHYLNGKKNGFYDEFYKEGAVKKQAQYRDGKVMWNKEYFSDGTLRMEENFKDALWDTDNKEKGKGKIFI